MRKDLLTKYYTYLKMSSLVSEHKFLEKLQHKLFINFVASDETDGEDGDIDPFLFTILPYVYGSYTNGIKNLVETLKEVKNSDQGDDRTQKLKTKLDSLIHTVNTQVVENKPQEDHEFYTIKEIMNRPKKQIGLRQYVYFYNYVLNKELDNGYKGAEPNPINVGEFDKLSRDELVAMFDANKFYELSEEQRKMLYQAVINDYCRENGVKTATLSIDNLPMDSNSICYGEYSPSQSKITLNKTVLDCIKQAEVSKNPYLPYKILTTLVHESQHRVQFENYNNPPTEKLYKVLSNMKQNEKYPYKSSVDYLTSYEELDARDCALGYIKSAVANSQDPKLKKFYNTLLHEERSNRKRDIPQIDKAMFANIYGEEVSPKDERLQRAKRDFLYITDSYLQDQM